MAHLWSFVGLGKGRDDDVNDAISNFDSLLYRGSPIPILTSLLGK